MGNVMVIPAKRQVGNNIKKAEKPKLRVAAYCRVSTDSDELVVHVLDPFVGTGTFITRLLQSGIIRKEDMLRKYKHEIHCNEIVLLAYYIADVNIESVFHEIMKPEKYEQYDGICLTDTFQLNEHGDNDIFSQLFP